MELAFVPCGPRTTDIHARLAQAYPKDVLESALAEMREMKYSTRIESDVARELVDRISDVIGSRRLGAVSEVVSATIEHYDCYAWTYERTQAFLYVRSKLGQGVK